MLIMRAGLSGFYPVATSSSALELVSVLDLREGMFLYS